MNWGEILEMYRRTCGQAEYAVDEQYQHLNYAYKRACSMLDLPELYVPQAEVQTVALQDWIDVDCDVYSIEWIQDRNTGTKLKPEQNGMRGRARYIEAGESRPPLGIPIWYVRKGSRIWLRDTPEDARTLMLSFRFNPADVDDTVLTEHPITPPQYDHAIIKLAAANYFELHPPENSVDGGLDMQKAQVLKSGALADLTEPTPPSKEENLDKQTVMRQLGYSFNVMGR